MKDFIYATSRVPMSTGRTEPSSAHPLIDMRILTEGPGAGAAILDEPDALSQEVIERGLNRDAMVDFNIIPRLKPGDWVVDGGAALGDHTAPYLRAVGPDGRVLAFEPHEEFFKCLIHNCPTAELYALALWHRTEELYLNYTPGNLGCSWVSREFMVNDRQQGGAIQAVALDDLDLPRLDYVKLDLEGAEYYALLGMRNTVAKYRPWFIIEMNSGAAAQFGLTHEHVYHLLDEYGYDYDSIRNEPGKRCANCDILATPKP